MSLKLNKKILLVLAVLFIFILIPASFAGDLNENQTDNKLSIDINDVSITADDNIIYVSPTAGDDGDGSESNPYTFSKAVENYDSSVNSKVLVKNGEYVFTEQINLNKDINIVGESYNGVILNGNGSTAILKASKGNIVLDNLKFVNGYSQYAYFDNHAGGLQITYVSHILINNTIFENNANGALSASGSRSIIDIENSVFDTNYVEYDWSARGAAINAGAEDLELNVYNTIFKNNYLNASIKQGAAIYGAMNFKSFVIDNCLFVNQSAEGSAIYVYCGGNVSVFNSQFYNNTAPVIYDNQRNNMFLNLYLKNNTFDNDSSDNIAIDGKVTIVNLENNDFISGNNIEMYEGGDVNYTVTLTDASNNPIADKEIIVTLTNYYNQVTTFNATTNSNGQISISMKNQTPGRYKVLTSFEGDENHDKVNTTNQINIKSEELVSLIFIPDSIKMKEGDSYVVNGIICDEYLEPSNILSNAAFSVSWVDTNRHSLVGAMFIEGSSLTFDLIECSLKTRDEPYNVTFEVDASAYEGYILNPVGIVTVDLSVDLPDIDLDTIYVSQENGSDEEGNGTQENPFATVQMAINLNHKLGGGKTVVVDEGTYEISNFNILDDVTVIGQKSETVFRQVNGNHGMFKIQSGNTVNFINLTMIDGYTTPQPYSLITAYGEGVVVNIDGCEFTNNTCLNGAVIAVSHDASVYVNNSKFFDNQAIMIQSTAGAIYVLDGYLKVTNSEFINNTASDGGAIWVGYPGTADIIDSTFINNTAIKTTVEIGGGGAIYTKGKTYIENSTFNENYAELYGGAIYVAGGEAEVKKSFFENNRVQISDTIKGSAIQSEPWTVFDFDMSYSILLSDDTRDYIALFSNNEGSTISLNNNYWVSNNKNDINTNVDVSDYVVIEITTGTTPVYLNDNTTVNVEFKSKNIESGAISALNGIVHDYTVDLSSKLNNINVNNVTIMNNIAKADYYAEIIGTETIDSVDAEYTFTILDSNKKDANANLTIYPGNKTTILVEVPDDLENNITINVQNTEYSRAAVDGIVNLTIDTLPGFYNVVVSYNEDETYKGFSRTDSFEIPKYPTALIVKVDDINDHQAALVEVYVTQGATGNVIITVNNREYEATIENDVAYKYIYDLSVGNYSVNVKYPGDDYYSESSNSTSFTVTEFIDDTPAEKIDGYAFISVVTGSESTITIRVPANLTNNVTIDIDGVDYSQASESGVIVLTVSTDEAKEYTVTVSYDGDDKYNEFSNYNTFEIYDYCWFINETGYRTLREAVAAAEWGDVIKGNISVYEIDETINIGHRDMPSEPWEVLKSVTITSMTDEPVTIKGTSHRLFFVDSYSELTLKNLILTGSDVGILDGGAVENMYDANVTIENCTISNFTADRGGAVFLWGQSLVKDTIFENNYANSIGGAVFVLSPVTMNRTVTFDNVTFINNSARSYGGALYVSGQSSCPTTINNSNFIDNLGHGRGGAIYITQGNVTIDNSVFDSNKITDVEFDVETYAGAVYVSSYVNAKISNSEFVNNYAEDYGGALVCDNSIIGFMDLETGETEYTYYTTSINNCSFVNNTADISGGAFYMGVTSVATVDIIESTFDSNKAKEATLVNNFGVLTIIDSEFTNNDASSLMEISGIYSDETYNAETYIIGSTFKNNNADIDLNLTNGYNILQIDNSVFDGESVIVLVRGEATLNNVSEINKEGSDYSVENYGKLYLNGNSFINPIFNKGGIFTQTYIIVLDNETISAPIDSNYTLRAIVCDDNGNIIEKGNLEFIVDDENLTAVYNNREFTSDYLLTVGNHTISAKYDDSGLNVLTVKTGVLISKYPVEILFNVSDINVGDVGIISVNVSSNATGNVTVKINNKTYELPIENGEVVFEISDLEIGVYPVEISYSGDDKYAPDTVLTNLTVLKVNDYPFNIDVKNITTDSATIEITLPNDVNDNVTLKIGDDIQVIPVKDGKAMINLSNLTIGSHDISVTFDGNGKYSNSTVNTTVKLNKMDSFVIVKVDDVIVGNDVIVDLTVPSDATGDIIITIGDKEYLAQIVNGKASYSVSGLDVGNYNVSVIYNGNLNYKDSVNSTSFNVLNVPIVGSEIAFTGFGDNLLSGVIKDVNGNVLANVTLNYVSGSLNGTVLTDNEGVFAIPVQTDSLATVSFAGNDAYDASNASFKLGKLTNDRLPTQFNIANGYVFETYAVDYYSGERGKTFTFQLNDVNGNPLSNKTIYIGYNGVTYNRTTNETGHASLQINLKDKNKVTFAIAFLGDDGYNANMSVCVVHVKQKTTSITAAAKTFKATAKTKKYTATLKSILGASVDGKTYIPVGKKVTMKINGKTYTAKIAKNGKVTFSLKITKKGKYTAVINYAGDTTYKASSKKVKITIN